MVAIWYPIIIPVMAAVTAVTHLMLLLVASPVISNETELDVPTPAMQNLNEAVCGCKMTRSLQFVNCRWYVRLFRGCCPTKIVVMRC